MSNAKYQYDDKIQRVLAAENFPSLVTVLFEFKHDFIKPIHLQKILNKISDFIVTNKDYEDNLNNIIACLKICLGSCSNEYAFVKIFDILKVVHLKPEDFLALNITIAYEKKELLEHIYKSGMYKNLLGKQSKLNIIERETLFQNLLIHCYKTASMGMLQVLHDEYPELFNHILKRKIMEPYVDFFMTSLSNSSPECYSIMAQFNQGLGNIDYDGGLVACAAIANINPSFEAVLLNNKDSEDEVMDFFIFLQKHREQLINKFFCFAIVDFHWSCGMVQITEDGVKLWFIDALGTKESDPEIIHLSEIARKIFTGSILINTDSIKRQNSESGCSVFTLDDLRKLVKLGKFPEELPLSIMRTTQSTKTIKFIQDKYAAKLHEPINKKELIFTESLSMHLESGPMKNINKRIEHKLDKLREKVWHLIKQEDRLEIELRKQAFTLRGFQQGILRFIDSDSSFKY